MAEAEEPVAKHGYDHIETYLKEPVVMKEGIVAAGGYLSYWSKVLTTRPSLPCSDGIGLCFSTWYVSF